MKSTAPAPWKVCEEMAVHVAEPRRPGTRQRVLRFTGSERAFHWLVAAWFSAMLVSGVLMGKHGALHNVLYTVHLASSGALLVGVGTILVRGRRRALARSARELSTLDRLDRDWLARVPAAVLRRAPQPPAGRFNAGQKVNFILVTLLFAALFVSGIGLVITGTHPASPVFKVAHVAAAYLAVLLVAGHLYMALVNPSTRPALRGMVTGKVDAAWVRQHHTRPPLGHHE